jgi:hypothetical protein
VPVNSIQPDPGNGQYLYAGTHLGVYRSTDGGATWARFGSGLPLVNVTDLYLSPDSVAGARRDLRPRRVGAGARGERQPGGELHLHHLEPDRELHRRVHRQRRHDLVSRSWNFGDGDTSTATNPSRTVRGGGHL